MTSDAPKTIYRAYLLRIWQETADAQRVWRILLENPHTGEQHGFATPGDLLAYLVNEVLMHDEVEARE